MTATIIPITASNTKFRTFSKKNNEERKVQYSIDNSTKDFNDFKMNTNDSYIEKSYAQKRPSYDMGYTEIKKTTKSKNGTEEIVTQKGVMYSRRYHSHHLTLTEPNGQKHEAILFKHMDWNGNVTDTVGNQGTYEIEHLQYLYNNQHKLSPNGKHIINEYAQRLPELITTKVVDHPNLQEGIKRCMKQIEDIASHPPKI